MVREETVSNGVCAVTSPKLVHPMKYARTVFVAVRKTTGAKKWYFKICIYRPSKNSIADEDFSDESIFSV